MQTYIIIKNKTLNIKIIFKIYLKTNSPTHFYFIKYCKTNFKNYFLTPFLKIVIQHVFLIKFFPPLYVM